MREAIELLAETVEEWVTAGSVPEIEWVRMRSLEFQEVLRAKNELVKRLGKYACTLCRDFEDHVGFSYSFHYMVLITFRCSTPSFMEKRS
jgi:hypothetical protein